MKTPVSFWTLDCRKLAGVEMISNVVGVRGFKLNGVLARHIRKNLTQREQASKTELQLPSYHTPRWRVRDRLTPQDIADIVRAFKRGTAKHVLAKRYGINLRSLKKLLREEGAKRRSRWDREI